MRRTDRQMPLERSMELLASGEYGVLSVVDGDGLPYGIPLNYYFSREDNAIYFHTAKEGRKMDLIRQNGYAAFEMDAGYRLQGGEQACDYTAAFRSVIGEGSVREVTDPEEKKAGLTAILRQSTGRDQWTYGPAMLAAVCVCRLDVETLACKEHL